MTDFRDFKGRANRLDDFDFPRIGHRLKVGEDEIHAIVDVEASGSGFDSQGRPKMLFEPHVFYRNLPAGPKRSAAVARGLAYSRWKPGNYPKDSYPRLKAAMEIDETAALMSASWGATQILGENYRIVGYDSPQSMVLDFMDDEDNHLEAMIEFIIHNNIDDDIRAHRWSVFARVYNGPGYKEHNYDGRLAARYAWWRSKPDTPWTPGQGDDDDGGPPINVTDPILRRGDGFPVGDWREPHVRRMQERLEAHGYPVTVDGRFGEKTEEAVTRFQADQMIAVDGVVGGVTWERLNADPVADDDDDDNIEGGEIHIPAHDDEKGAGGADVLKKYKGAGGSDKLN